MASTSHDPWDFLNFVDLAVKPPISTNSVKNYAPSTIRSDAEDTHIVIHPRFQQLAENFLSHKRSHGSRYEKELYATPSEFTWQNLTSRLLLKRPLVFMGANDHTVLRDGTFPRGNDNLEWNRNGTEAQDRNEYLRLSDYLSYDEIMLGSLLGVSGPSYFVNDGNRYNGGRPGREGTFEDRGIIVGLVGARFERMDRMDSVFCLPDRNKPKMQKRLQAHFQEFFGVDRNPESGFDIETYKARIQITADILLLEANDRAASVGRTAYVYVVGLGLGVWQYYSNQVTHYLAAFSACLSSINLQNVSTVEFAYIPATPAQQERLAALGAEKGIKVLFSKRNPAEKLETGELLVLSYAWDGNAFPGNEYWQGSLSGSGDPAAACMSTVGELHNPVVNEGYTKRIRVPGSGEGYA